MSTLEILLLALALSADAFTVGAALGIRHRTARQRFRLSWHFGLFQALMPLVGALAGSALLGWIADFDHWLIFGLLGIIGGRMVLSSFRPESEYREGDSTRGLSLIGLSLAVSIDALAAGFTLAVERAPLVFSVVSIGLVAFLMTWMGMLLAAGIRRWVGKRVELFAGLVLIGLGVKLLLEHLAVI